MDKQVTVKAKRILRWLESVMYYSYLPIQQKLLLVKGNEAWDPAQWVEVGLRKLWSHGSGIPILLLFLSPTRCVQSGRTNQQRDLTERSRAGVDALLPPGSLGNPVTMSDNDDDDYVRTCGMKRASFTKSIIIRLIKEEKMEGTSGGDDLL